VGINSTKLTLAVKQSDRLFNSSGMSANPVAQPRCLSLAGPPLADRQELFDFIVAELKLREVAGCQRIHPLRVALFQQRDDLLPLLRCSTRNWLTLLNAFILHSTCACRCPCTGKPTSTAYWQRWNQLHHQLSGKFHLVLAAVKQVCKTPRASSLVENLNSRLRNYFLRRQLGPQYLSC